MNNANSRCSRSAFWWFVRMFQPPCFLLHLLVVSATGHEGSSTTRKWPSLVLSWHDERGYSMTRNDIAATRRRCFRDGSDGPQMKPIMKHERVHTNETRTTNWVPHFITLSHLILMCDSTDIKRKWIQTISTGTVHTSAKVRPTSVAISARFCRGPVT